jgi:peptidoglycan/xylan/chitin deacetylase (PgdA/CDA1 family)
VCEHTFGCGIIVVMMRFGPLALGLIVLAALVTLLRGGTTPVRFAPPGAVAASIGGAGGGLSGAAEVQPVPAEVVQAPAAPLPAGFTPAPIGVRPYIPILMYHYVRYVDRTADPLGFSLSVTPEQFAAQLAWLAANGYETVRMDSAAACVRGEGPCPVRAVVLTFDDGYLDAYTEALPRLQQYGFVATFYIVGHFVGQPNYLGWDELRALRDAGMEIGAHTMSHPDLTRLGPDSARAEIAQSRAALMTELNIPVLSFCYPGGRYNADLAAIVRDAGFTSATTTVQDGPQADPFTLPRLRIYGDLSQAGFEGMIRAVLP